MRVSVAQFYTKNVPYGEFSESINKKYCEDNGYSYFVEKNDNKLRNWVEDRAFTWIKPKFISEVLSNSGCDYLLFLDIDAIVSNFNKKIESFIDENYEIIGTQDYSSHSLINAGVLLVRNSPWTMDFMKTWWNICNELKGSDFPELSNSENAGYYKNNLWHDQTCLTYLYKKQNLENKIKIISNNDLNWREYDEGNFIFHAFSYGYLPNRKIDTAYYKTFNIKIDTERSSLLDLSKFYDTDKESFHRYISNHYEKIMKPARDNVKRFCEIGLDKLNSVKMWRDYFTNANIVGCDIVKFDVKEDRIETVQMDQSKEEDVDLFCSNQDNFDVILDDGSHKMYDQQMTFAKLFKKLNSGGFYIIEDLHTSVEARMPEKAVFGWGDPNKTTTLEMLENFIKTGEVVSDYISDEDKNYLKNNISSCEILRKDTNYFSITSLIRKK